MSSCSRQSGFEVASFVGLLAMIAGVCLGTSDRSLAADSYELVWADEFDQDGPPDPKNWKFESGFVRNDELQWYQPDNARCAGGQLVIEARREQVPNPEHDPESRRWNRRRPHADYTSSSLMTRDRHEWLYGRFVMRGRIDTRPGLWPAFWTLGSARGWPGCGEIDIMEYYDNKLLANVAWLGERRVTAWDAVERPIASFGDKQWSGEFHEWRMDWDHDWIRLYLDDELINETAVATAANHDRRQTNPFREPHYLILNLALGGTRGGDPSQTEFPARFEVDYVRVYQRPPASQKAASSEVE
jgi:beta-glucanase (GH16 family)